MRLARIVCLLFSSAAFAMQGSAPPFKMGLWEITTTSTTKVSGKMAEAMQKMGQPVGAPTTQTMKLCYTTETWERALSGQMRPGCTRSNVVSTAQKYSLTLTCNRGANTMAADTTTFFDSSTQLHGTTHIVSNSPDGAMNVDGTSTAKFLSADCGDVKPLGSTVHP